MKLEKLSMLARGIAILLCLCSVFLVACSQNKNKDPQTEDTTSNDPVDNNLEWWEPLGEKDLNGRAIRVTSRNDGFTQGILEMGEEECDSGNIIESAIYERNFMVEEQYNCIFEINNQKDSASILKNELLGGSCSADILFLSLQTSASFSDNGLLKNMLDLPELNLENDYWDQNARDELEINHELNFMCGDMTLMTGQGTWLMIFNKTIASDLGLGNIYDLVSNNEWTADKMWELACRASEDLNGDGTRNEKDKYGLLAQISDVQMFYQAFGQRYTQKDSEGDLQLVLGQDVRAVDVFDKISTMFADSENTLVSNNYASTTTQAHTIGVQFPCFKENRALFYASGILRLFELRAETVDYGLLPFPKFDETQDRYYHTVKVNWGSGVSIPEYVNDVNTIAFVLEALAAASAVQVKPAYYETTLGSRLLKDPYSYDMLDIVLNSITYDAMTFYKWGDIINTLNSIGAANTGTFKSTVDSSFEDIENAMNKTLASRK